MFYEINNEPVQIEFENIDRSRLSVGIVKSEELGEYGRKLGIDEDTIEASQKANPLFRTGVEVRENYTFAELRIVNRDGHEDFVSIYVMKNFVLIVDIDDKDSSTVNSFLKAIKRMPVNKSSVEKIICYFIDGLLFEGNAISEELRNNLTEMEESIVNGTADEEFNIELLGIKKKILKYYNYYGQIIDIAETLEENDNDILDEDKVIYISNLNSKVTRLEEDMNALSSTADHIQDAYATFLDQKMNSIMKIFTVITTVFFPLTVIVGWYGMNFENMPELTWKYGYLYVILISIACILLFLAVGKKKKWFS
ncbi:MAG: hypothetical protein MJ095_07805 [Oscillospiraceae bacterium]|nr:hypothetical protein [Oscillospiraceae bacterium]